MELDKLKPTPVYGREENSFTVGVNDTQTFFVTIPSTFVIVLMSINTKPGYFAC